MDKTVDVYTHICNFKGNQTQSTFQLYYPTLHAHLFHQNKLWNPKLQILLYSSHPSLRGAKNEMELDKPEK